MVAGHIVQRFFSEGSRYLFIEDYALEMQTELLVSLLAWSLMIISGLYSLKRPHFKKTLSEPKEAPVEAC